MLHVSLSSRNCGFDVTSLVFEELPLEIKYRQKMLQMVYLIYVIGNGSITLLWELFHLLVICIISHSFNIKKINCFENQDSIVL